MKYLFSCLTFIDAMCAIFIFVFSFAKYKKIKLIGKGFCILALASAIWSFGFSMLYLQTDYDLAHIWKSCAIFGTFLYVISAQFLISDYSQMNFKVKLLMNGTSLLGIPIYFVSIQRNQTVYYLSEFGATYNLTKGIVSNIYTIYFLIIALNILFISIYLMKNGVLKRHCAFGKRLFFLTIINILGSVLDMIFPSLGMPALPGSNITQFFGLIIVFDAIRNINESKISISNMSEYIYHSMGTPILIFDAEKNLKISNDSANEFLNIDPNLIHYDDKQLYDYFDADFNKEFQLFDKQIEFDCNKIDGQVPCNISISRIFDKYGDLIGFIAVIHDLSERMKYIEELKTAREEADISNRAKSDFLANMSHEIRTPMNAIIGFSEIILNHTMEKEEIISNVEQIRESSYGLLDIINDILDISKIESGKMKLISNDYKSKPLLQRVCSQINTLAMKKKLEFKFSIDPTIPSVLYGDETRIQEILINIMNNAIKYTIKGYVMFEAWKEETDEDGMVNMIVKVSDTGKGIKQEDIPIIFEDFEQVNKEYQDRIEGTGLGLSIVKGYMNLMNGTIKVESELDKGSCFILTIPQKLVNSEPIGEFELFSQNSAKSNIGSLRIKNTKVLVVDDNEVNLQVISKSFECYGIEADIASSGQEAIKKCIKTQYPIVFMDQMMPHMDGVEAMHIIRDEVNYYSENGEGKIVVLTADAIKGVRERLLDVGFDEYLVKPIDYKHLEEILVQFIDEKNVYYENKNGSDVQINEKTLTNNISSSDNTFLYEKITIPGVDTDAGIKLCGGKIKNYKMILKKTVSVGNKYLLTFNDLIETDIKTYTINIHGCKGMCYGIGATDCGDKAKELELAAKNGDIDFVKNNHPLFERQFSALLADIEKLNF